MHWYSLYLTTLIIKYAKYISENIRYVKQNNERHILYIIIIYNGNNLKRVNIFISNIYIINIKTYYIHVYFIKCSRSIRFKHRRSEMNIYF